MKKKVLIVGPGPDFIGGISEFISGMRNSSLQNDFELILFDSLAIKQRDKIIVNTKLSLIELRRTLRVFIHLHMYLVKYSKAAVHIHSSSYWSFYEKLVILIIAKLHCRKVYFHIHGGVFISFYQNSRLKRLFRVLLSLADTIISVSPEIKEIINLPLKTIVIGNGINLPDLERNPVRKFSKLTFLSVSVLEYRKRIDLILEAVKQIKSAGYSNFQFVFAGDGPVRDELMNLIQDNGLEDVVDYQGVVRNKEKDDLFRKSHVFISTSLAESFGISIAEGMSYGLGIISTAEGIASFCLNNGNGIVIPKNDVEALAEAMLSYITEEQNLATQSIYNYNYINENYSWKKIAGEISNVYQNRSS